ncbi:hypothetical protein DB347_04825 [Opitutaceae bacterium EW11]|nr:hypothetical protein DB347_04825 [Opitutaceae bacterium EW11]
MRWLTLCCGLLALAVSAKAVRPFTVLVYDVENLAGVDGKTTSADYRPAQYSRAHLMTKMNNIARVAQLFEEGKGPDIILFQELERDFTNNQYVFDHDGMLKRYANLRIEEMLGMSFTSEIARMPIEALLLKTFSDRGMKGYRVAAPDDAILPDARRYVTHLNVIFTRFPIGALRTYPIPGAPAMMEVQVEVEGYPLYLFNIDWSPEAGDKAAESLRIQAAEILRTRLDEIFGVNPNADVIIAGNFNCFYDQKLRFQWDRTALQDVLKVKGDELLLRNSGTDLYNFWYELPPGERGSEINGDTWSTCMQMVVSRGLYDFRGIQYVDNSFSVAAFEGINATPEGKPFAWSFRGMGEGFSNHFPLAARFTTVRNNRPDVFLKLPTGPSAPLVVAPPR